MEREIRKTFNRLLPRLEPYFVDSPSEVRETYFRRLEELFPDILALLLRLYGGRLDFFYHLETILATAACYAVERDPALRQLDTQREADPLWFQSEKLVCYVDLFAGTLKGISEKIPYFKELGLSYLHLMPLFKSPQHDSDGGCAVSSFREVNPALGTVEDLQALCSELRENGISPVLDKALADDEDYQDYFYMFPDRYLPDQYEKLLREIFPQQAPGSFSYRPEIDRWVWTTFNTFQRDLNYRNPEVFNAILGEMLFLANLGVEVLRLDAVAFIWKGLGTSCENLPQAHWIIQAYNALVRLVAPAMAFKSEAIVHPDEVAKYFGEGDKAGYECPLSYNPTLMALLWEALATREVKLLRCSMQKRLGHPSNYAWVNYVRVHDDIGWSFADEDVAEVHITGFDHRQFLNAYYTGQFGGSLARGLLFNFNHLTRDGRISGSCASLAGLEAAQQDPHLIDLALKRILLLHSIILSIGGIPLIYLGDELGTLNDYSFTSDPNKAGDNRWVHRPALDWERAEQRHIPNTVGTTHILDANQPQIFAFMRWHQQQGLLVLANFSEAGQSLDIGRFRVYGFKPILTNLVTGKRVSLYEQYLMQPYEILWLLSE
ncbi:MAG: alpha-amylase family protein [Anaerolineae bacterium]|nr:alpha-amylase family protein [Anaerolineae bacterium]